MEAKGTAIAIAGAPSPQTRRRLAELAQEKIRLRKEIRDANITVERFHRRHCRTVDGKLLVSGTSPAAREKLEEELRGLKQDLAGLLGTWHATLNEQQEINDALQQGKGDTNE